jgi:hypothetical protein
VKKRIHQRPRRSRRGVIDHALGASTDKEAGREEENSPAASALA